MKISLKVIAIILSMSILLIIIGNWLFGISISNYLTDQENIEIKNNANNIISSLKEKEAKYKSVVNDWAHWDETYDYINNKSSEYEDLNLNAQSLGVLNVNLMIFYNKDNQIINKLGFDLTKQGFAELPVNLLEGIKENVTNLKQGEDSTFVINSDNKFYIIAISKTTNSLLNNTENGTLVVGRLIDEAAISALQSSTNGTISFSNINNIDENLVRELQASSTITKINNEKDVINAYISIPNPTNKKASVVVTLTKPMDIYKEGLEHMQLLQVVYSLLILLLIIITFISIRLFISKPIYRITKYLNNIDLADTTLDKLPAKGNDEFSIISKAVNNMLSKIGIQHDELRKSEERLKLAQTIAHVGNWELDLQSNIIYASDEAIHIYGLKSSTGIIPLEVVQRVVLPEYRQELDEAFNNLISNNSKYEVEYKISRQSDMEERFVYSRAELVINKGGTPIKVLGIIHDITERKEYEEKILFNSYRDSLTGLHNRRYLDEEMQKIDNIDNLPMAVIIGDVNGLKLTNDVYGHKIGDEILQKIANIIQKACRPGDIIARWGGDEFIIILPKTNSEETKKIVNNIKNTCANSKVQSISISISLGYYIKKKADEDMDIVFKNADDYMYKHKLIETSSMRGKTINTLLHTLYEKNPREEAHSRRVSDICVAIGTAMGLTKTEVNKLKVIGLIHDIGKIAINEEILNKPAKLTEYEFCEIKRHPEIGYRILSSTNELTELSEHILKHHEKLDGSGYPNGIKADEIPLMTRILTVADAFDAMTSARAYQKALSQEFAIAELRKYIGSQFDESIVNVFITKVLENIEKSIDKV